MDRSRPVPTGIQNLIDCVTIVTQKPILYLYFCPTQTKKRILMTLEHFIKENRGTIVDVRTREEFMGGHVATSINIPLNEMVGFYMM